MPTAEKTEIDTIIESGKSLLRIALSIGIGFIKAQIPRTAKRLKIFEPVTLLSAISLEPLIAAEVLTASSGALVPIATMVNPIITPGTLKVRASEELPSTKKSAPFISVANPTARNKMFRKIFNASLLTKLYAYICTDVQRACNCNFGVVFFRYMFYN